MTSHNRARPRQGEQELGIAVVGDVKQICPQSATPADVLHVPDPVFREPSTGFGAKGRPLDTGHDLGEALEALQQLTGVMTHAHARVSRQRR